ncbi:MAG: 30S ribosomal protein S4 [Parcubacteria group bacterium GW2011_GWA1_33_6]|uniref:Small ribosomal subunit protein uS4 n=1 Tax=Candidatus Staskawiczbacteria bacterium RIFCSPHIGHO2_02_FULL_33_16 TaxID=1802204 RepID=A0A1G2HYK3_9BACT|nr:MAG: 30S ribosomal protein S4 [Parcubacteria group bacterium GW2011_GWA2_33_14]KKP54413.1 MAG: 30S ribosomal protein S4 [Parcubacteria group bacterium GW2011_GWA1_33_6]OGZ67565.1 MAG: 30S ribosomal protein S4 [Candidatus Staskawiczbacteria bacterium RIFCSPHIGHO2_02_FULL_33_16]OGZ70047.1 MAG: 30S ribosomal protein S4 [Candidatus Staskawiczbacteria bacterium RIFCSPLOWO2_01_FULL_33_13]
MLNNQFKNDKSSLQNFSPAPVAIKNKKREKTASEYKKSLQEKQTLKRLYGLSEKQFKRYVKESLQKTQRVENVSDELIKRLEKRLDNVVFRLGFAQSRKHSRQLVNHSYFLINGKSVNIPSFQVTKGDVIAIKETKKKKSVFKDLPAILKKTEVPLWLNINKEKFEGKTIGDPSLLEVNPPVEISLIFEFYSR